MQLEIITPEHKVFEGEAVAAQFPGKDGLFQVLDNHAAIISVLKQGEVKIDLANSFKKTEESNEQIAVDAKNDKVIRFALKGGVVEVSDNKVIVLAD